LAGVLNGGLRAGDIPDLGVDYAVTIPGPQGAAAAFCAEAVISAIMMWTVLNVSNSPRLLTVTSPCRRFGVPVHHRRSADFRNECESGTDVRVSLRRPGTTALWIYFTAPLLGMHFAASLYWSRKGVHRVFCAKLHHDNSQRCIFRCNYRGLHE
jgi:aquaporin Z